MEYLFVYGTLLTGIKNDMSAYLSKNAVLYSKGYFHGKLYDLGDYPGAINSSNQYEKVYGNIFKIPDVDSLFPILDEYEGVGDRYPIPNEYRREKIKGYTICNEELTIWVYLYNFSTEKLPQIESGDYLEFRKRKETSK